MSNQLIPFDRIASEFAKTKAGTAIMSDDFPIPLPLREWLELGQVIMEKHPMAPKYFRKHHTMEIRIGANLEVKADGKTYRGPARYCLEI